MNSCTRNFLALYYEAINTGDKEKVLEALLAAKQMYNYTRAEEDRIAEKEIISIYYKESNV